MTTPNDRYHRQKLLPFWGETGQARLREATVLVAGCGGLGGHLASHLVRAGCGTVRVVDRDAPELSNLHRQTLFDENDVASGESKAAIAAKKLARINAEVRLDARTVQIDASTIDELLAEVDLALDATDNFATRFVLNEACRRRGIPWVHGGALGTTGVVMNVWPGRGPCLRCVFPEPPPEANAPSSGREGILGMLPAVVAAYQATEACRILLGEEVELGTMWHFDIWRHTWEPLAIKRNPACPICGG